MPDSTRAQIATGQLQKVSDEILADVQQLPPELITWVPGENIWTVMDILCHIREFVPFWTKETVRIIRRPDEQWGRDHTDADRLAAVANTSGHNLRDVTGDIRRLVDQSVETLKTLSDADLSVEATSKNPRWGLMPASFVLDHLLVQHLEKHLGQIRRNVTQFGEKSSKG
jgi:uncharacterized damage-inducible protein DinB